MKYAISLVIGMVIGVALFVLGLYYNPFVGNPSVSPLAMSDLDLVDLSYSLVASDSIVFTNDGESHVEPHPAKVLQLWEPTIKQTRGYVTVLNDSRGMPAGLGDGGMAAKLIGAGIIALGFVMYATSTLVQMEYPKAVSLVVTLMGIVLMVCGWPAARWSWFAVAFLLFALPVPVRLYVQMTMPLRFIAQNSPLKYFLMFVTPLTL